jgi:hypothetical protein
MSSFTTLSKHASAIFICWTDVSATSAYAKPQQISNNRRRADHTSCRSTSSYSFLPLTLRQKDSRGRPFHFGMSIGAFNTYRL